MRNRVLNMISEVGKVVEQIPELTHLGNPILRKKCKDVSLEQGKKTSDELIKVLKQYQIISGIGVGLAAPQIGRSQRVFITYEKNDRSFQTFLNPKVLDYSRDHNYYRESCLSSRFLWADIKRPVWVKLGWTDLSGRSSY
jgi:peptide deformylase